VLVGALAGSSLTMYESQKQKL
jgi:hypothetical protein